MPVERVSGEHPDEDWRADALAGSRHTRLIDELREPLDSYDEERAMEVCGAVCREVLRDFAPALILLKPADRRRVQALATYVFTLFDFARQTGVEGERLAAINRWEFALESALDGETPGQPAFVLMSATEAERPWNRDALDAITREARSRAIEPRPRKENDHRQTTERLGAALLDAVLGEPQDESSQQESTTPDAEPSTEASRYLGALIRLFGLLAIHDGLRRRIPALPREELPDHWWDDPASVRSLRQTIDRASARLTPELEDVKSFAASLPPRFRRAAIYAGSAAIRLNRARREVDPVENADFPTLGAGERIGLLTRARFSRRGR